MENIVVERVFHEPVTTGRLREVADQWRWCREQNRVTSLRSYVSGDGRRTVCVFRAPDAEAVRRVNRQAELPGEAWHAAVYGPEASGDDGVDTAVIVERTFADPITHEELAEAEKKSACCLNVNGVRYLRSYFSSDCKRMLCIYTAPDAEAVRRTQKQMGLPFDKAWTASVERLE